MSSEVANPELQKFLLLAKGTQGKATQQVIKQVLGIKHVYVFAELLAMQCVQNLAGTECDPFLKLLSIFSHGTYRDYKAAEAGLPALSESMLHKLRLLTICTLASRRKSIPYSDLQEALDVANVRELEDLAIAAFYAGLLKGKMDQRARTLEVQWAASRDLAPGALEEMCSKLDTWCLNAEAMIAHLQHNADSASKAKAAEEEREAGLRVRAEATQKRLREKMEQKMSLGGGVSSAMDVDSEGFFGRSHGRGKGKSRARGLLGSSSFRNK